MLSSATCALSNGLPSVVTMSFCFLNQFDSALSRVGLLAKLLLAFLQPIGRNAVGLIFRFQLIGDIGIGDRIGDLRGPLGARRVIFDRDHSAADRLRQLDYFQTLAIIFSKGSDSVVGGGRTK